MPDTTEHPSMYAADTERRDLTRDCVYARRVWSGTHYERDRAGRRPWAYRVTAELHRLGLQAPYFSLTFEQIHRATGSMRSCGASDTEIARLAPAAAPFLPWHLTSPAGPMHYRANALYWAGLVERDGVITFTATHRQKQYAGDHVPPDWPIFASTVKLGAVAGDPDLHTLSIWPGATIARWLDARLPDLQAAFRVAMDQVFPEDPAGVAAAFAYDEDAARARYTALTAVEQETK